MDWKPDIIANGHGTYVTFSREYFQKVMRWSKKSEAAVQALCPSGDLNTDYYLH